MSLPIKPKETHVQVIHSVLITSVLTVTVVTVLALSRATAVLFLEARVFVALLLTRQTQNKTVVFVMCVMGQVHVFFLTMTGLLIMIHVVEIIVVLGWVLVLLVVLIIIGVHQKQAVTVVAALFSLTR